MKSTTGGQHSFAQIPSVKIQRSQFDRSCGLKTTFDAGLLVPIFCDEALPGDTMAMRATTFARLATPLHPVMDNLYMDTHFFAVPVRLLWDNFQKFNGEQRDPGDSTDFLVPEIVSTAVTGYLENTIHDYLGIPTKVPDLSHSALWHRAYNLIFNEWFRDQNMIDSLVNNTDDGPDLETDYTLQRRGKRHDYFTSCLPWPQKGPAVELPLGDSAVVTLDGPFQFKTVTPNNPGGEPTFDYGPITDEGISVDSGAIGVDVLATNTSGVREVMEWNDPQLVANVGGSTGIADLSTATASTINMIRQAFQIQRLYERDARGGSRYTEIIRSHFGVTSPDQRLQRPEFLGGGSTPIQLTTVTQTSNSDTQDTPQGNLAAFGIASSSNNGFTKSFVEHSIILGLVSVRADLNYQQGLPRMFSRRTRWDFFWPSLANLGEQAVLNKEIFAQGSVDPVEDDAVFGYQERFAEYRYKPSMITGLMRSNATGTLDLWHVAQDFADVPTLSETFIEENPPIDRVIAVPTEPHMIFDAFFSYKCARPMPTFGVPGMIDHF